MTEISPGKAERLVILNEECAEVCAIISKIFRHGFDSYHPDDPSTTNLVLLEYEINDVLAIINEMKNKGDISSKYDAARWEKKKKWTHFQ